MRQVAATTATSLRLASELRRPDREAAATRHRIHATPDAEPIRVHVRERSTSHLGAWLASLGIRRSRPAV
jgi:hypothetical protein